MLLSLVVINEFDIPGVAILKPENDAPVGLHPHGPLAPQVTLERMEPVVRYAHGLNRLRDVELRDHHFHPVVEIAAYQAAVAEFVEAFQPAVSKAPYHTLTVKCLWTLVKVALDLTRRRRHGRERRRRAPARSLSRSS